MSDWPDSGSDPLLSVSDVTREVKDRIVKPELLTLRPHRETRLYPEIVTLGWLHKTMLLRERYLAMSRTYPE